MGKRGVKQRRRRVPLHGKFWGRFPGNTGHMVTNPEFSEPSPRMLLCCVAVSFRASRRLQVFFSSMMTAAPMDRVVGGLNESSRGIDRFTFVSINLRHTLDTQLKMASEKKIYTAEDVAQVN